MIDDLIAHNFKQLSHAFINIIKLTRQQLE